MTDREISELETIIATAMRTAGQLRVYGKASGEKSPIAMAATLENWSLQKCQDIVRSEAGAEAQPEEIIIRAHDVRRTLAMEAPKTGQN